MNKETFANPTKEYRASPFWSWTGELKPAELKRQIREMKKQGYGGYFMHSREGLETKFLGKEWFEAVKACLDEGKRIGMESWIYDEDRWPSGCAGGLMNKEWHRVRGLDCKEVYLSDLAEKLKDPLLVAVFGVEFEERGIMSNFRRIKTLKGLKPKKSYIAFSVHFYDNTNWYNGTSYVDLLNPEVTKDFLKIAIDPYVKRYKKDFGEFMPGSFIDEPNYVCSPKILPWTDGLPAFFKKLNGYDMINKLPLLAFDGEGMFKMRHDFWKTLTKRYVEAFTVVYAKYCEKHGLKMTGHYLQEDTLLAQIRTSGAIMPHYEYEHVPGIDHLGKNIRDALTLKQVSSVAHQFGRNRILCEIFGVSGHSMTFEDQKWIADFHFSHGVTFMAQHLLLYTMRRDGKRDYPPNFNYQQTYFKHYRLINDYFARAAYITSTGDYKADVLLLHPIGTAWGLYKMSLDGIDTNNAVLSREVGYQGWLERAITNLMGLHVDFDLGDEIILGRHGKVTEGSLKVAKKGKYKIIVVPPSLTWFKSTVKLLEEFLNAGGKVIFLGEKPVYVDGNPAASKWNGIFAHKNVISCKNEMVDMNKLLGELIENKVKVQDMDGNEIADISVHYRIDGKNHIFFMSNKSRHRDHEAKIFFPVKGEATEFDMQTGKTKKLETGLYSKGLTAELKISRAGSRAFVIDSSKAAVVSKKAVYSKEMVEKFDPKWKFKRLDLNTLTLDFCKFRVDNGGWSDVLPVYKARQKAWVVSGLQPAKGIQPWAQKDMSVPCRNVAVEIETKFYVEKLPKTIFFLLESSEKWELIVNGKEVSAKTTAWQYDKCLAKINIAKYVKSGANTINISGRFDYDMAIEDMYLSGDFGVKKLYDNKYVITGEPGILTDGNWGSQGYPFYSGSMIYEQDVVLARGKKNKVTLELNNPKGTVFFVYVNGKKQPLITEPWKADITSAVKDGKNNIKIEVVSSLRNTFGPLHHRLGDDVGWVGPNCFVDDADQKLEYVFEPYGLLEGASVIVSTK